MCFIVGATISALSAFNAISADVDATVDRAATYVVAVLVGGGGGGGGGGA